jgi:hypothetical protein
MFTFLIISDIDSISDSVYQAFSEMGTPRKEFEGRLVVESMDGMKGGWIAFQPIKNIQDEYESDELENIKSRIFNPSFYLIEGRDSEANFSNTFIQKIRQIGKILIDNDHGVIDDLRVVKEKIKSGEDWLHSSP